VDKEVDIPYSCLTQCHHSHHTDNSG
jgi:hypothetical protein